MANTTLTPDQQHIETLRLHGARVHGPDGLVELNSYFVGNAVNNCIRMGCNAITYELFLPEIDEPMLIAIWKDGHVDTGCRDRIYECLNR